MSFEFMYGNTWYKYEGGWIHKKTGFTLYEHFCPVHVDIQNQLGSLSADQLNNIMEAIIHGYCYGFTEGKKEKIREFKRVFNIA